MPTIEHDAIPFLRGKSYASSGITPRKLVNSLCGSQSTEIWEQLQIPGGRIGAHHHDVEETIMFLSGSVAVSIGDKSLELSAPVTIFIPPGQIHSIENIGTEQVHLFAFFPAIDPRVIYRDTLPS